MKNSKNLLPALIIALGPIISVLIYAYTKRYENRGYTRIDNWTGKIEMLKD